MSISRAVRNPGRFLSRSADTYWTLASDPRTFFDEYIGSRGIGKEFVLLGVIGALGTVGNYFVYQTLIELYDEAGVQLSSDLDFALWQRVAAPLLGIFLLWIALTTALYLVGWLYSTVGEYFHLLKRTAWALVPLVIVNVLHSIAALYVAFTLQEGDITTEGLAPSAAARANQVWMQAGGELPIVAVTVLSVVVIVWVGYLAALSVEPVRDIDRSEAYRVAAVPTVAYALFVLYGAYTALTFSI